MKPPEPASNEEIERRIEETAENLSYDYWGSGEKGRKRLAKYALRAGMALSSELKAQKPVDLPGAKQLWEEAKEAFPEKPVDESLDEAADKFGNTLRDGYTSEHVEAFKSGASYQAPISEAIGEAKGIKWVIEFLERKGFALTEMKEEAKRRGKL